MSLPFALLALVQTPANDARDYLLGQMVGMLIGVGVGIIVLICFLRKRMAAAVPSDAAPCPQCGATKSTPIAYTWWGGALGPKLLHHAACAGCGTKFNGKTGTSNNGWIAVYLAASAIIALVLLWMFLPKALFA